MGDRAAERQPAGFRRRPLPPGRHHGRRTEQGPGHRTLAPHAAGHDGPHDGHAGRGRNAHGRKRKKRQLRASLLDSQNGQAARTHPPSHRRQGHQGRNHDARQFLHPGGKGKGPRHHGTGAHARQRGPIQDSAGKESGNRTHLADERHERRIYGTVAGR